ncbi:MAG: hypothetical protein KAV87_30155 [Desulfobacteraceae bacterium]|nr:hypothetical protein [Desulfobacteraceae bacterium]
MNYISCPSYEPLYFVLHLWNSGQRDIKVITYNASVELFCNHLGIEVIYFEYPVLSTKNVFKRIYALYDLKKRIDRIVEDANINREDKFYLLGNGFSYPGFYLTKKFSKKCCTYFKHISLAEFFKAKKIKSFFNINYLRIQYLRYLIRLVFGINLTIYYTGNVKVRRYTVGIDGNFLRKYRIKKLDFNKSLQELRLEAMVKQRNIIKEEYNTMVVYEWFPEAFASPKSLRIMYDTLFSMLSNYAIKKHPGFIKEESTQGNKDLPQRCQRLPAYIPSELLFNNIKQNIIGIASSTLVSAADVQRLQAISLLELVQWKNRVCKEYFKDFLTKRSNRIIFVYNFEELEGLIS